MQITYPINHFISTVFTIAFSRQISIMAGLWAVNQCSNKIVGLILKGVSYSPRCAQKSDWDSVTTACEDLQN